MLAYNVQLAVVEIHIKDVGDIRMLNLGQRFEHL
jgi:hypothetical protein